MKLDTVCLLLSDSAFITVTKVQNYRVRLPQFKSQIEPAHLSLAAGKLCLQFSSSVTPPSSLNTGGGRAQKSVSTKCCTFQEPMKLKLVASHSPYYW